MFDFGFDSLYVPPVYCSSGLTLTMFLLLYVVDILLGALMLIPNLCIFLCRYIKDMLIESIVTLYLVFAASSICLAIIYEKGPTVGVFGLMAIVTCSLPALLMFIITLNEILRG